MRVEHLRSSVHFLPIDSCDDPQRVVFTDDLTGFLQPITTSHLNLQLVVTVITLLKVPLLPTRHSTLEMLSFLDLTSCINNVESLLAAVYPVGPVYNLHRKCILFKVCRLYIHVSKVLLLPPFYIFNE